MIIQNKILILIGIIGMVKNLKNFEKSEMIN